MIQYPNGKKSYTRISSTANRGMSLEDDINLSNAQYLLEDLAVIHKKPTPITIVTVDYPKRSAAKITGAYFKLPSTTDDNGIYKGRYIDFDAKECNSKTAFPFSSIHEHQIKHLRTVRKHGAVAFLIIRMTHYGTDYLIPAGDFLEYYDTTKRKSLPYSWIREKGHEIKARLRKPCDYLEVIARIMEQQEEQHAENR